MDLQKAYDRVTMKDNEVLLSIVQAGSRWEKKSGEVEQWAGNKRNEIPR